MQISHNALSYALIVATAHQRKLRQKGKPFTWLDQELEAAKKHLHSTSDAHCIEILAEDKSLFPNAQQPRKETRMNKSKLVNFTAYLTDAQQELRMMKEKAGLLKKGSQFFDAPSETFAENREAAAALTSYVEACALVSAQKELYVKQAAANFQRVYRATKDLYKQLLNIKVKAKTDDAKINRTAVVHSVCTTRLHASRTALNFLRHDLEIAAKKKAEDAVFSAPSTETPTVWPVKVKKGKTEGVKAKMAAKNPKKSKRTKRSVDAGPAVEAASTKSGQLPTHG